MHARVQWLVCMIVLLTTDACAGRHEDILACALRVAESIGDAGEQSRILGTIAHHYIAGGYCDRAIELACRLPDDSFERRRVLRSVALHYADRGDISAALNVAQRIGDDGGGTPWDEIADRCATPEQFDQVVDAAKSIDKPHLRAIVLVDLADTDAAAARQRAGQLMSEAMAAARNGYLVRARCAVILARQGQVKAATELLAQAAASASAKEPGRWRWEALDGIARRYAQLGLAAECLKTVAAIDNTMARHRTQAEAAYSFAEAKQFAEALEITGRIDDASHRASVLRGIATIQAENGQRVQAVEMANSIEDGLERALAFSDIAGIHGEAGQGEQAERLLVAATETARTIGDPFDKADALCQIAYEYTRLGRAEQVQGLLKLACASAISVPEMGQRDDALHSIAGHCAASALFEPAVEAAGLIDDVRVRAYALGRIAEECTAITQLARVVEMAQALDMPDEEAYVLSRVVAAHVEAERFELALSTVRNIPASPWRGTAMSSIARGYVYIGRCSDAIDLAQRMEDRREKVDALSYVAEKCTETKEADRALSLALSTVKDIEVAADKASALIQIAAEYARRKQDLSDADRAALEGIIRAIDGSLESKDPLRAETTPVKTGGD